MRSIRARKAQSVFRPAGRSPRGTCFSSWKTPCGPITWCWFGTPLAFASCRRPMARSDRSTDPGANGGGRAGIRPDGHSPPVCLRRDAGQIARGLRVEARHDPNGPERQDPARPWHRHGTPDGARYCSRFRRRLAQGPVRRHLPGVQWRAGHDGHGTRKDHGLGRNRAQPQSGEIPGDRAAEFHSGRGVEARIAADGVDLDLDASTGRRWRAPGSKSIV